jgi:hydroxyethylthiazole kinase-like uncharacterized protein yjeF
MSVVRYAHTVVQVRDAEAALLRSLPPGALMQRAATGLAAVCAGLLASVYGARVVILAGSGDNGGDALYAGAQLAARGARVDVLRTSDGVHEQALAALHRHGGRVAADEAVLDGADLVLDGIVGIGGSGGLREAAASVVRRAEASGAIVVAVDLPSGIDADTGELHGEAVRADVTVTFGTYKPGLLVDPAAQHVGALQLVDIGLGPHLDRPEVEALQLADVAAMLPRPGSASDKYSRGVVGVAAGSDAYTGAAVLCAGAATRSGAGMVRFLGPGSAAGLVRARWPEVVIGEGRVQAWTLGSGLGEAAEAADRARTVLDSQVPAVVDADGLRHLGTGRRAAPTLLTPHAGELARLLGVDRGEVEARRLHIARQAAQQLGAVVLLKGSTTVVAAPDGRARVNPTGTPWLATAGSGDVLAGLCGALLAGGLDPFDAAAAGAWLHGLAARRASHGTTASHSDGFYSSRCNGGPITAYDVLDALPAALRSVLAGPGAGESLL